MTSEEEFGIYFLKDAICSSDMLWYLGFFIQSLMNSVATFHLGGPLATLTHKLSVYAT